MNDETFAHEKERVLTLARYWRDVLCLIRWEITYRFFLENIPNEDDATMTCTVQWPYQTAYISVNCSVTEDLSDEKLEEILVHEFAHIIVNQMRPEDGRCTPNEERVCTMIADAILTTRDAAREVHEKWSLQLGV